METSLKNLNRKQRLKIAKKWVSQIKTRKKIKAYQAHFGVDRLCAVKELTMVGVKLHEKFPSRWATPLKRKKAAAKKKKVKKLDQAELDQAELDQAELDQAELDQAELDQAELDQAELDQAELDQAELDQIEYELSYSDENFYFIAGYTSGGAPYGITWKEDEMEELEGMEGMEELES